jgi:hypothetical protein
MALKGFQQDVLKCPIISRHRGIILSSRDGDILVSSRHVPTTCLDMSRTDKDKHPDRYGKNWTCPERTFPTKALKENKKCVFYLGKHTGGDRSEVISVLGHSPRHHSP